MASVKTAVAAAAVGPTQQEKQIKWDKDAKGSDTENKMKKTLPLSKVIISSCSNNNKSATSIANAKTMRLMQP